MNRLGKADKFLMAMELLDDALFCTALDKGQIRNHLMEVMDTESDLWDLHLALFKLVDGEMK
jgi:hypothetical protein